MPYIFETLLSPYLCYQRFFCFVFFYFSIWSAVTVFVFYYVIFFVYLHPAFLFFTIVHFSNNFPYFSLCLPCLFGFNILWSILFYHISSLRAVYHIRSLVFSLLLLLFALFPLFFYTFPLIFSNSSSCLLMFYILIPRHTLSKDVCNYLFLVFSHFTYRITSNASICKGNFIPDSGFYTRWLTEIFAHSSNRYYFNI